MRYLLGALIAAALALVQVSSAQQFYLLGVSPSLVLVFLVCWLVVRGLDDVLPMVAVTGLLIGMIDLQTPGLVMLALVAAIAAAGFVRELHVVHSETLLVIALVLMSSVIYEGVLFLSVLATGGPFAPVDGLVDTILPAALVNLVITLPVYLLMRLARPASQRNAYTWA